MTTVKLDLVKKEIKHTFEMVNDFGFNNIYDSFKIDYTSGKRVYLIAINNGIPRMRFYKNMNFEDGKVIVKFGKDEIEIGLYFEIE